MLWIWLMACGGSAPAPAPAPEVPPVAEVPVAVSEAPAPALSEPTEARYGATHVLLAYKGAVRAAPSVQRSKAEALDLATRLRTRALQGEDIEQLAREHSDGPSAPRGGSLGVYLTGTMVPSFESAVASVEVGAIGPVVETPFGYHVVRRDAVIQRRLSQILVTWSGSHRSKQTRTKAQARALIEAARAEIQGGVPFAEEARRISEDSSREVGGDLGLVAPGQMVPDFEHAAYALDLDQLSPVIETAYGFHLILRTE